MMSLPLGEVDVFKSPLLSIPDDFHYYSPFLYLHAHLPLTCLASLDLCSPGWVVCTIHTQDVAAILLDLSGHFSVCMAGHVASDAHRLGGDRTVSHSSRTTETRH